MASYLIYQLSEEINVSQFWKRGAWRESRGHVPQFNLKALVSSISHFQGALCETVHLKTWYICMNSFSHEKTRGKRQRQTETRLLSTRNSASSFVSLHCIHRIRSRLSTLFDDNALISNIIRFSQKLTQTKFNIKKSIALITNEGYLPNIASV